MRYSFRAKKDYELDLEEGDVVLVLDKQEDGGWWRGMIGEREGWFPADCLPGCTFEQYLTHHIQSFAVTLKASLRALYMLIFLWQVLKK